MNEKVKEYLKIKEVQKEFKKNGDLESLGSTLDVNKLIDKKLKKISRGKFDIISNRSDTEIAREIVSLSGQIKHLKLSKAHGDFSVMYESDMDKAILELKSIKKVLVKALIQNNL